MFRAGLNDLLNRAASSHSDKMGANAAAQSLASEREQFSERSARPRLTPRKSLIVVLPDNHVLSPELVAERLPSPTEREAVDVIVACAGQPTNLGVFQRNIRELQVLLAPSGTTGEKLRELAIMQTPGDIVTLLSGAPRQGDEA
jgi:hypothetical protein